MIVAMRRLAIAVIAVIFVLIAAVFAYGNQEPIAIDIGIMRLEDVSLTVALAITFAAGAVFGGLFASFAILKQMRERSKLRRELRRTEAELKTLRSLPLPDAD
jgi:uncharacterized membrane protein YciS (DUF1049 family)